MDAGIILAGQTPDILGAMDRGRMAAESQINLNRQNALAQLFKEQGAGILAGDQNALNALAGMDPNAAMAAQQNLLGMQAQKQEMAFSAEKMGMLREESKREAEAALAAQADKLTAEQLAAEHQALSEALSGGAFFYQNKDKAGYDAFLKSKGLDPAEFPFESFPAHAATVEGVLEAMKAFQPPTPEDEYGRYVAEQTAKGLAPLDRIGFENAKKGNGVTTTTTNADGSTTTIQVGGAAGGGTGEPRVGDVYNPNEVQNVIGMIDAIANDPSLDRVVGPIEGGGGNNIDDLGTMARAYYGGDGTALIEKIGQLQSNAWLSARAMLKGGGAITDYESRKAEAAVARLSRAKSEKEFRAALKDLRDAITEGEAKLRAGAGGQGSQPAAGAFDPAEIDALMNGP